MPPVLTYEIKTSILSAIALLGFLVPKMTATPGSDDWSLATPLEILPARNVMFGDLVDKTFQDICSHTSASEFESGS